MKCKEIIILAAVFVATQAAAPDYCSHEPGYLCAKLKHVGCSKSDIVFQKWTRKWKNFRPIVISSEQKALLLEEINEMKNRVAGGEFADMGFDKAVDLPVLKWHDELEQIASLSASKVPFNEDACVSADSFNATSLLRYRRADAGSESEDAFIQNTAEFFANYTLTQDLQWYSTYFGYSKFVGCGAAEYDSSNVKKDDPNGVFTVRTISCLFDALADDLKSYNTGEPCSDCPNDGKCDLEYSNLCPAVGTE